MKRFIYRLIWALIIVGGLYGWALAGEALLAPNERTVSIEVTEQSFQKAWGLCDRYMKTANGVIGQVGLNTRVGENVVLPCRVVLSER